ncbi:MAG: tRNA (N6-isopentenyl adenosine(37)-C2)-methylthiotransferase MiaB, partial [Firmicutes bacterium]|nr:tRNA (N6-isopentenyl adenosine(37)-C2)-methylthiotransferase MiaB [Bacillota bacterium]
MSAPRYFIRTYGCQMNERDSEILAGQLEQLGYRPAKDETAADLVVVNTCAVRHSAESHAFGYIGGLKELKDQRRGLRIAVAGCMAQEPETVAWLRRHAPHVDLVFGTHNLHRLPELLERAEAAGEMVVDVWDSAGEVQEHLPSRRRAGRRAFVNVIYGCDRFCTFCIVPYTRGRERSRRPEAVLEEVRALAAEGFSDVTLLGQNVNSYGHDLDPAADLADLLTAAAAVPGIRWVRYLTSHPKDFSSRLIAAIAGDPRITRHLHLPVQSGSTPVLKRMNRKYTAEQYRDLVARIRAAIPDVVLTTDIIVGFPGETEADFAATLDLVRDLRFDAAFTFLYSARAGTPAARWEAREPVPNPVKKARLNRLMELQYAISLEANQA